LQAWHINKLSLVVAEREANWGGCGTRKGWTPKAWLGTPLPVEQGGLALLEKNEVLGADVTGLDILLSSELCVYWGVIM